MSQWTHFNATIRFDALRALGMDRKPDLGRTCDFESPQSAWDACDVPCGTEGSIQHQLWTNPSRNDLAAYTVMIWGDLRDYEDADELEAYLVRICRGQMVRQGVAEIAVEYRDPIVLRHGDGGWERLPAENSPSDMAAAGGLPPLSAHDTPLNPIPKGET